MKSTFAFLVNSCKNVLTLSETLGIIFKMFQLCFKNVDVHSYEQTNHFEIYLCILGGNPTPVRGILEKIQPKDLQNLPEAVERSSRPRADFGGPRARIFSSNPEVHGVGF